MARTTSTVIPFARIGRQAQNRQEHNSPVGEGLLMNRRIAGPGEKMSHYYEEDDLERFPEIGKYRPDLYDIFMNYYQGVMSAGALTTREKALIALAVAHAVQCPYCIDAYTRGSLEAGSNLEEMTEAIHVAAAIRGGATLVHGIQVHNAAAKITM
ncbi:MAG: arsenosugar biosynthesis-associated peroxidase-like protein [Desulfobaccales bacterium]